MPVQYKFAVITMGRAEYIYDDDVPINLTDFKNSNCNQRKDHLLYTLFCFVCMPPEMNFLHMNRFSSECSSPLSSSFFHFVAMCSFRFWFWFSIIISLARLFILHFATAGGIPLCFLGLEHVNKTQRRSRFNYLEKAIKIYNWMQNTYKCSILHRRNTQN